MYHPQYLMTFNSGVIVKQNLSQKKERKSTQKSQKVNKRARCVHVTIKPHTVFTPLPARTGGGAKKSRGHKEQRRKPLPRTSWEHFTTSVCGWSIVISKPGTKYMTGEFNTNTTGRWHVIAQASKQNLAVNWEASSQFSWRGQIRIMVWDGQAIEANCVCNKWHVTFTMIQRECVHDNITTQQSLKLFQLNELWWVNLTVSINSTMPLVEMIKTNDNDCSKPNAISLSSHPFQSPLLTQGLQHYGFKYHQLLSLLEVCLKFDRQSLQHNCNESIRLRVPLKTTEFKGPPKKKQPPNRLDLPLRGALLGLIQGQGT